MSWKNNVTHVILTSSPRLANVTSLRGNASHVGTAVTVYMHELENDQLVLTVAVDVYVTSSVGDPVRHADGLR